jgi:hypothetical protein
MPLDPVGAAVVTDIDLQRSGSEEIEVRRAPGAEASIVAAARAWALAFEAVKRQESVTGESTELALYEAIVGVDALKSAEQALYQAVLAAESSR